MSKKFRIIAFLVFAGIFLASFTAGTWYRMSDADAKNFLRQFHESTKGIGPLGIFWHNSSVALPMFIPGFGPAWGAYSGWQTGAGYRVLVIENPQLIGVSPLAIFLSSPFGILELVAYSIGMSRGFLLAASLIRLKHSRPRLASAAIEVGIVLVLLLVGGFVEHGTMQH